VNNTMTTNEKTNILGVDLEWKLRSRDTGGHYCFLTATVPPGVGIPLHQHPDQEAFFVLEGNPEFALENDGSTKWCVAAPGDMINIPPDALHGFRNTSDRDVRVIITCTARLGEFFNEAGTPRHAGGSAKTGPTLAEIERVLEVGRKHGQRFAPPV